MRVAGLTVAEAAQKLCSGGVIVYPTEAVWGIGCDPMNQQAVMRLLDIKQRPISKGMILIAARIEQLMPYLEFSTLDHTQQQRVLDSWPGPNTWIIPASLQAPPWITGQHTGIAVRVTDHPAVIALCNRVKGAIVSTSANLANHPAAHSMDQIDPAILAHCDGWLQGETAGRQRPSTIRDALTGAELRP